VRDRRPHVRGPILTSVAQAYAIITDTVREVPAGGQPGPHRAADVGDGVADGRGVAEDVGLGGIVAVGRGVARDVGRDNAVPEGPGVAEGTGRGVAVAERCVMATGARLGVAVAGRCTGTAGVRRVGALYARRAVGDGAGRGGIVPVGCVLCREGAEAVEIATSTRLMRPVRMNPTRGIRSFASSLCPRCTTIQMIAPTMPHRLRPSSTAKTTKVWYTIVVLGLTGLKRLTARLKPWVPAPRLMHHAR
jgi:hypothetical protein